MSQIPGNPAFRTARLERGWPSQTDVADAYAARAAALGEPDTIDARQVRRWESAKPGWPNTSARRVLTAMFGIPLEELGFRPHHTGGRPGEMTTQDAVRRRSLLQGVLGAAPLLTGAGRERLTASLRHARSRRYADRALVGHLATALDEVARADGSTGPRQALPAATELLALIEQLARETPVSVRHELLGVGARAAEFTAWLHRDAGAPPHVAGFFYDRVVEWATVTGDGPMHAYVLLRKAQAAGDDPARMLDLARTAAHGPWQLPPRARAEALQQEARALALSGAAPDTVARTLDQARHALGQAGPAAPASCTGPLCAGYSEERLMAQAAISHREAGQPARAVALLQEHLAHGVFAPRDRAFFTAHPSGALAVSGEPDHAAATGLAALRLAAGPGYGQAIGEIRRTAAQLRRPHARRPAVRELRQALTALPV